MGLRSLESESYGDPLGFVVDESTTVRVIAQTERPLKRGQYVIVESEEGPILGLVEESLSKNELITDIIEIEDKDLIPILLSAHSTGSRTLHYANVRLLSLLGPLMEGKHVPPRIAPHPGARVYSASRSALSKIFAKPDSRTHIHLGTLSAHEDIDFFVDVNKMVTRHLAIIAVTGAGKSNTVTVIVSQIVKDKKGSVLIFDMHGEYKDVLEDEYMNIIEPKLDPTTLDVDVFAKLVGLGREAVKQQLYLRNLLAAWRVLYSAGVYDREEFFDALSTMIVELMERGKNVELPIIRDEMLVRDALKEYLAKGLNYADKQMPLRMLKNVIARMQRSGEELVTCVKARERCASAAKLIAPSDADRNSALPSLLIKLEDAQNKYRDIFQFYAPTILQRIKRAKLNVVDMSHLDEEMADVVASTYLKKILIARKNAIHQREGERLEFPVFIVLEEAHVLAPQGRNTLTKYWVGRITKEGRKFGVGLCMVSQRPKSLDQDALSQANNLIVLRLIEPSDQRHVQASSEALSEELVKQLPSLATGEAIVLGPMVPLPAIVKIKKAERKSIGSDIDVVAEWGEAGDLGKEEELGSGDGGDDLWDE